MNIRMKKVNLMLKKPFVISHSNFESLEHVFIFAEDGGIRACGEAVTLEFFNQPFYLIWEQMKNLISYLTEEIEHINTVKDIEDLISIIKEKGCCLSVICAIEMLLVDYLGKKTKKDVWELFDVGEPISKITPVTLTILPNETPIHLDEKIVKMKLGGNRDLEYLEYVKENQDKQFILDINQGWTIDHIKEYQQYFELKNILFIEEPIKVKSIEDIIEVRKYIGNTKLFLDESICSMKDVEKYIDYIDGINIKIVKFGGLINSIQAIKLAKFKEKEIMMGCFLESSLTISYAYSISKLFDYIDLDGATFLADDPFYGAEIKEGIISFSDKLEKGGIRCEQKNCGCDNRSIGNNICTAIN